MNGCRFEPEQLRQGWKLPLCGCGQRAGWSAGGVAKCTSAWAEFLLCSLQDGEFLCQTCRPSEQRLISLFLRVKLCHRWETQPSAGSPGVRAHP